MLQPIRGIHHVTAIAGDPQANVDFYTGPLGLRLVKQTVNFDDPGTWHLYYGDALGRPGSVLTFFPFPGARRGKPEFQAEWGGAVWHFATAENLAAFESEPERYAPQFGGWCAFALSTGHYASDVDPREAFTLRDDKLYLNWSRRVKQRWLRDVEDNIATAESNWPAVRQQLFDDEAAISRKWF